VAWEENRDGNKEIYITASNDQGFRWSHPIRVTDDRHNSTWPDLAAGPGKAYIVWQDDRDGNWEIYFEILGGL
jgi:hypothetical protein